MTALDEDLEDVSKLFEAMNGQESDNEGLLVTSFNCQHPIVKKELEAIWETIKKCADLLEQNELATLGAETAKVEAGVVMAEEKMKEVRDSLGVFSPFRKLIKRD